MIAITESVGATEVDNGALKECITQRDEGRKRNTQRGYPSSQVSQP